ncbi:MAG: lysine-sensitive aspartokinase 3 [Bryobacteraceae bacterium]
MIVMKFGGSSVESAVAIQRVASIVAAHRHRHPVVVVSAMGKTTNRLLAIGKHTAHGDRPAAAQGLRELKDYHWTEATQAVAAEDLPALSAFLDTHFAELEGELDRVAENGEMPYDLTDSICAFGERLSSAIVTLAFRRAGLDAVHVDSRTVIITDSRHTQAHPLYSRTYSRLKEVVAPLAENQVVVMGGFIGSSADGITTTLGRGGSDFTASIVGAGIDAEEIQIWTDVDGMLTCDPRILPGGHRVKTISFAEAAELAFFGAKVLHPFTVLPAIDKNIPVLILNSRHPEREGTRIVAETVPSLNPVKAIACKANVTVVNVRSARMLMAYGFLHRIFEVFDRYRTPVDVITTSEVSVSLTIESLDHLDDIRADLERIAEISVEKDQASISLVGENVRGTAGIAGRTFGALRNINIRMISQGASLLNLTLVVDAADLKEAVERLHTEFFTELDPLVFDTSQRKVQTGVPLCPDPTAQRSHN